ncbi:hypothetical protein KC332_g4308 [Hortaea werneckii]|nr:hypothetical protein KC358_g167 [Hortaea werneckii]KAI6853127.1 hypothetical protein KC350_g238 [Hortaea werneckii]KAI6945395.1 hypothetical protein KC341_g107 [Hortaea werneckii]KAI6950048.1 hypothetical protein KC348_g910 [Hortaea werneckii]KAI6975847.1 hypothetical protein KC321_g4329 [Hortaea werneckii]
MFFRNALVVGLWADASLVSGGRTPRHRRQADSNGGVDPWKNTTVAAPSTSSETIITTSPEDYDITSSDSGGDAAIPETSDSSSSDEQVATYSTTSSSIELTTSSVPDTDPASIPTSSQSQALPPSSAGAETYSSSDSPSVDFYSGSDSSSSTYPDESAPELTTTSEYIDTWTSSTETVQATVNQPTGDAVSTAYVQPTSPNAVDSSTSDVLLSSTSPPQDESARTSYGRQTGDGASTAYVPATSSSTKGTSTLTPQPPSSSTSTSEDEGAAKSYGKPTGEAVSPAYLPPTSSGTGDVLTTIVSSSSAANPQEEATAEYVDTRTPTAKASSVLPTGDGASPSAYVAPTSQGTGDAYVPNAQPSSSSNSDDDTMSPPASSPSSPSSVIMVGLTDSYVTYSKSASTGTVATDMKQAGTDSDSGNTYKETAFAYPAAASGSPTALPKYEETTYGNPTGVSGPDTGFSQGVEPLSSTGVSGPMTGPLAQHTDMPSGYSPGVSGSTGTSTSCTTTGSTEINTYQPTGGSAPSSYGPQPVGPATAPSSGQPSVIVQPTGPSSGTPTVVVTPTPPQPYNPTGHPRYPYGTGRHSRNTTNAICSGATLNVLQASLDWWYTATYTHVASTFSVLFDRNDTSTGWTLLPETTTFDVASALASPSCTSSLTSYSYYNYNGGWNATNGNWSTYSYYDQDCFSTPAPVAAATTVITQTAHTSLKPNVTSGSGKIPDVIITPTPATISVPGSTGAFSAGTPFVYFSQYEIMSKYNSTRNGSVRCAETTSRYNMTSPFGFAYTGGDVDGQKLVGEGVIGDVNPDFLKIVNVSNAVAGNWVAKPTVAVVQQRIFVAQAVLAAFTEAPLRTLATPEPTLPDYVPLVPSTTDGGSGGKPTGGGGGGGRIESSAESLAVPGSPATTKEATKTSAPGSKDDSDTGSGGGSNSGPNSNNGSGSGSNSGSNDNDSSGSGSGSNLGSNDNNGSGSSSSSNSGSSDNNGSGSSSGSNSGSNDNGGSGNGSGSNSGSGDSNGSASDSSSDSGSNGKDASGSGSGSNSNDGNGSGSDGNSGSNANGGAAVGGSSSSDDDGNTVLAPFVAQDESSQITLNIPVQPTQTVVTAEFQGQRVTATALSVAQDQGPPSPSPGPNVGNLVSAVESAAQPAKPTNALDVFNSAANQGDGKADDEAVASAIMAGIGGSSAGGAAQSGGQDGSGSGSSQDGENGGGNDGSSSSGSGSSGSGGSGGSGSSGDGASGSSQGSSGSGSSGSGSNSGSDSQGASGSSGGSSSPDGSAQGQSGSSGSQAGSGSGSSSESGSSSGSSNGQAPFAAPILSFGDSTITAGPTPAVVFGGQTAFPGGDAIVQDGHTISLVQRGNALVVDGSTVSVAAGSLASSTVLDVNGVSVTASPEQVFNVDGQRLAAGGSAITVDGTTVSVASDGSAAVINGQTRSLQMTTMGASGSNPGNQQAQGAAANIPLITVGSQTFTANAATQFSLASGATLTPGGVVTFDGTTVSLARDASQVVVNGQTTELNAPRLTPAPMVTLDGTVYKANPGSTFDINGSILTPGGVITSDGTRISLAPGASAIVVDGETTSLQSGGSQTTPASNEASITAAPVLPVDGHRVQPQGQGATYVISGQTLTPGGAITYTNDDGEVETLSLNSPANQLVSVIDGTTSSTNLPNPAAMSTITAPPVLNVNGKGYAANGGTSYVISGQTLTPGGAITITNSAGEAETLSLNSAANELYTGIEGTTATSMIAGLGAMSTGAPVLTIDGQTYTANSYDSGSGPTYVISGQTLTRGGEITLSGSNGEGMETVSLDSAGTAIEIISDGQTSTSTIPGAYEVMPTAAPILTINGETFTAMNNGATYIISGKTLTPNEAETVTISGRTFVVSLAPQASLLVISAENGNGQVTATSYETLFPVQMTGGVVTNTVDMNGGGNGGAVTRTSMSPGASATGSNTPEEYDPSLQNSGSSLAVQITGFAVAAGSLVLAVFL